MCYTFKRICTIMLTITLVFALCSEYKMWSILLIVSIWSLKLFSHIYSTILLSLLFFAWDEDEMKYLKSIIASLAPFSVLEINASLAPVQWCLKSICFSCSCSIVLEINNVSIGRLRRPRLEPHKTVPKNLLLSFTHVLCNGYVGCYW
jgi:hypothetical protein